MVDLMGKTVIHKAFGEGEVISQGSKTVTVKFADKNRIMEYPSAFVNFVKAVDEELQNAILAEAGALENIKKQQAQENKDKSAAIAEQLRVNKTVPKKVNAPIVPIIRANNGTSYTFLVFQGGTFDDECKGGFIWAPKHNSAGGTLHHWDRLVNVRKGDIILHCSDGDIKAVSRATDSCSDAEKPGRQGDEWAAWQKDGRMVPCEYTVLKHPICHSDYNDIKAKYCNGVKYAPFKQDGSGNQGYLYDLPKALADYFMSLVITANPYILQQFPEFKED